MEKTIVRVSKRGALHGFVSELCIRSSEGHVSTETEHEAIDNIELRRDSYFVELDDHVRAAVAVHHEPTGEKYLALGARNAASRRVDGPEERSTAVRARP